ncbi:MAG TPA: hypothetical protein PK490_22255 [Prosthecobacter sp.]|nr:hypothetical protein [Prosthecobacter sp.]
MSADTKTQAQVLARWRGMGALLAVAFYSLFFAAHRQLQETPAHVRDAVIFEARSQSVFLALTEPRERDKRGIGAEHPAFVLLHQPPVQLLMKGWLALGLDLNSARKHGVAMLTGAAGALSVVMVYHALLWSGIGRMRALMLAAVHGAGTGTLMMAALPEVWIFAGMSVAALAAVTARGALAPWWLHLAAAAYAVSCFIGSVIAVVLFGLVRCAQDTALNRRFTPGPLLVTLAALTLAFGLANTQRAVFPLSPPLPEDLLSWRVRDAGWPAGESLPGRVTREIFLTNLVAPPMPVTRSDPGGTRSARRIVVLDDADWSRMDWQKGVGGGWLLLLALACAGLCWRARLDPYALGILAALAWTVAALAWHGSPGRLLLHACLWTPLVVIAAGLGLERALEHWPRLRWPVALLLAAFLAAQVTRNWAFLQQVAQEARL